MRARRARRALPALVLALAASGATSPASPASAAAAPAAVRAAGAATDSTTTATGTRVKLFRVTSRNADQGGARARGTLRFNAWNDVQVIGRIRDLCPGDGRRGVVRVQMKFRSGNGPGQLGLTRGRCGGDPEAVSWPMSPTSRAIVRVRVEVCTNGPEGGLGNCRAKNYRNPKVRRATSAGPVARPSRAVELQAQQGGVRRKLFRVTSKSADEGGSRVKGTLKFRTANQVSVVARVNDLCPGDGDWGLATVSAVMDTGRWHHVHRYDRGGCESPSLRFRHTFTQVHRIERIRVQSCVHPTGPGARHLCRTRNYDNPHA